jgi:MFS family permease
MNAKLRDAFLGSLKSLDRRFKVVLAAVGAFNWANNLPLNYSQIYAVALGASPMELSSLNSVGGVVSALISAPAGWLIDRHGVKKMFTIGLALSAVVSAIYGCASSWLVLIPAVILTQISFKFIMPLADLIFVGTSRPETRAQAMGLSRMIWAMFSLVAPMMAAFIVTYYGGINVQGIRPLYFIQLLSITLVIAFVILRLEELRARLASDDYDRGASDKGFIEGFRDLLRGERWLKEWVILMGLWRFATSISMPFIMLWMVYTKGADPYVLGAVSTVGFLTSIILQVPVGVMADRIGRKKAFLLIRPLTYIGTILLVITPNPQLLVPVGALGALGLMGGISDVSFIPFITMFWEVVPAEKRGRWFGLTGIFDILTVPAFMLGGFLWQAGLEVLVLLLPLFVEVFTIIPLLIVVPDTLGLSKE